MAKKKKPVKLSPMQIGVKTLAPGDLRANPHNPRLLFDGSSEELVGELRADRWNGCGFEPLWNLNNKG